MQIHSKEVYCEFSVDVMEFIKIFVTFGKVFGKLLFPCKIIRTLHVHTFMYAKDRAFFDYDQGVPTVRAFKDYRFVVLFAGNEDTRADGTLELTFAAIVVVEVFMSGTATRTDCFDGYVTFGVLTDGDWLNEFTISLVEVFNEFLVIVLFLFDDDWRLVYFEFLILRRVGVIESPLLERYIFADK